MRLAQSFGVRLVLAPLRTHGHHTDMKACTIPVDFIRRVTCDDWLVNLRFALTLDLKSQMRASVAGRGNRWMVLSPGPAPGTFPGIATLPMRHQMNGFSVANTCAMEALLSFICSNSLDILQLRSAYVHSNYLPANLSSVVVACNR